ncbi:segment polarity protein dishevelled [Paragonimus westermani]|uniref:Segment polarity protein dishevelled n=1 Tax=Paragonimus westermani TaxID=34504 RepID=A0A5J4NUV4_9TREM|nr:segment polarity protein dishevelled [Paragonimus westermani]
MEDAKIIYHVDDEETPYLVKVPVVSGSVTLGDFKNALNRPNYKFFFKSLDADFGVVKEEITDDDVPLPCFNGKVISWLVSADSSTKSDNQSGGGDCHPTAHSNNANKGTGSANKLGEGTVASTLKSTVEPPSEQEHAVGTTGHGLEDCDTCVETDSVYSGGKFLGVILPVIRLLNLVGLQYQRLRIVCHRYEISMHTSTAYYLTHCLLKYAFASISLSTATGTTLSSSKYARHRRQRKRRRLVPIRRISEDASSFSSMTDSTMSLNVITVTLNMDTVNFLGISIVGQSNKAGDGGIYVGSIMRGGAVAQDGRIEPGDMILEVNRISFEDMSNDEAVRVLREEVQKPGPITLVVAKCWDPSPKDYFTVPRQEPVRPIDPRAWVLHTNAMTGAMGVMGSPSFNGPGSPPGINLLQGGYFGMGNNSGMPMSLISPGMPQMLPPSLATLTSLPSASNITSKSLPEVSDPNDGPMSDARGYRSGGAGSSGGGPGSSKTVGSRSAVDIDPKTGSSLLNVGKSLNSLTVTTDMATVVHSMLLPDSGLEIHDRTWLKITIPNAFIGSDLVDWLYSHVDGFSDRRDARRYAAEMLKYSYIRHTVNKSTFSEQCYYVFGDIAAALARLNFDDVESVSEVGGPSGLHGSARAPAPQRYLQLQPHSIPDSGSSGMTVVANPNNTFGLLGPMQAQQQLLDGSGCTGVGQLAHSGPHYPYPPILYPVTATSTPTAPTTACFVDGVMTSNGQLNSTCNGQGQLRMNCDVMSLNYSESSLPGNALDVSAAQPMMFPQSEPDNHGFAVGPRNPLAAPVQSRLPQLHQQPTGNSSSSCSSHSSASSASSSSSSASSGAHLGPTSKASNVQTLSAGPAVVAGNNSRGRDLSAPTIGSVLAGFTRNAPPSVQSTSVSGSPRHCMCLPAICKSSRSRDSRNDSHSKNTATTHSSKQDSNLDTDVAHKIMTSAAVSELVDTVPSCISALFMNHSSNCSLLAFSPDCVVFTSPGSNRTHVSSFRSSLACSLCAAQFMFGHLTETVFLPLLISFCRLYVQGASSTSSASRQNGTGASATGSGSGSAATSRVPPTRPVATARAVDGVDSSGRNPPATGVDSTKLQSAIPVRATAMDRMGLHSDLASKTKNVGMYVIPTGTPNRQQR